MHGSAECGDHLFCEAFELTRLVGRRVDHEAADPQVDIVVAAIVGILVVNALGVLAFLWRLELQSALRAGQ